MSPNYQIIVDVAFNQRLLEYYSLLVINVFYSIVTVLVLLKQNKTADRKYSRTR